MDTHFTSQLFLSILFFAPGMVLFAGVAFVGGLMLLEKAFDHTDTELELVVPQGAVDFAATGNPGPGRIVNALKTSMNQTDKKPQRKVHN